MAKKKPNELGLYDMSGNEREWCLDDYQNYSDSAVPEFPRGNDVVGSDRVFRGGSWNSVARFCRSANRVGREPGFHYKTLGFRVVLVKIQY